MNVASLELCKELYELSGWGDTSEFYVNGMLQHGIDTAFEDHAIKTNYPGYSPAYDLGYLLRKLPGQVLESTDIPKKMTSHPLRLEAPEVNWPSDGKKWAFFYENHKTLWSEGDTPEDAICALAIELFKQGVLPKDKGEERES